MGFMQFVGMLIPPAIIVGYSWYKSRSLGVTKDYLRTKLGLQEGEQISAAWHCVTHVDQSMAKQVGLALAGMQKRGNSLLLALTSASRLTIGDNEGNNNPPLGFQRGQVVVSLIPKASQVGSLAGPHSIEPAVVMLLTPVTGDPIYLEIARSGFEAVTAWSQGF